MSEKPPEKRKQLIHADLNFISNHSLEAIIADLNKRAKTPVKATIIKQDADTALFNLTVTRDGHMTAEVNGRLKRWAGDMTHVYADGEAYIRRDWKRTGRNFLRQPWIVMISWCSLVGLLVIYGGSTLVLLLLMLLLISLPAYSMWILAQHYFVPERIQFRDEHISKPEAKDRDRLLDLLVAVIRDHHATTRLADADMETIDSERLSDEELGRLLAASSDSPNNPL